MQKFNSKWTPELVKDLIISHQNRSHNETAIYLTNKYKVLYTRDVIKNKFNSLPENQKLQDSEPLKSRDYFNRIGNDESIKGKRTYFISSAIAGCELNDKFLKSIKVFLSARKAKLVILPMRGIASINEEFSPEVLREIENNIYTEYIFNSNLQAIDLQMPPMAVSPLIGLSRLAQKKSSLIVSSTKQDMEVVPTSNLGIPHVLYSTATISEPNYPTNRSGMLAKEEHIVGGLIVEIQDNQIFHIRQVRADKDGSFYDLDKQYTVNGIKKAEALAMVWGDLHCGEEDTSIVDIWKEIMNLVKPKHVFLHDAFSAKSISHHNQGKFITKANLPKHFSSLKNELDYFTRFIGSLVYTYAKTNFYIVRSNHDEHLDRFLDESRFFFEPQNYRLALDLAIYKFDGFNPLEKITEKILGQVKNLIWLERDKDFELAGCQLSNHGDLGINGSKGSLISTEKSYGNAIVGHSHSPKVLRNSWVVGTSTPLRLDYTKGSSSWLNSSVLLYPNGQKQLINIIEGSFKI